MTSVLDNGGGIESSDIPPEGKYLKKGWASRDEQRWKRKGLKRRTKQVLKKIIKDGASL